MKKIIILLVCFYSVCVHAQQSYIIDQIVAIVGSKPIKQSDVEGRYLQYRAQGGQIYGDMKCIMFEELLREKLLMNQAEVDSLVVEPNEVERELERRLNYFIQVAETQENVEKHFNKSMIEIRDDLRTSLHEQLLAQKMQQTITENVKITPSEVRSFFNKIPKDSIPQIQGQAEVAQIVMYPPYSDETISGVRQELLDLRRRIIDGESFRTMAVLYSECSSGVHKGGELGFSNRGEWDPEFAKAAFALKNVNDISRIVESKNGFHIIQLMGKRGDQVNVRHILITPSPKPEDIAKVTGRLDTLVRLIRKDSLNWNTAALYYSQDEKTKLNGGLMINPNKDSPLFQSTRFEMNQFEPADLAVIRNLKIGEISEPYQSRDDKNRIVYKIIKLKTQTDPHFANLKDDYNFLQDAALNDKMMKEIMDWVEEKIESSYIYIEDSFRRCGSDNNWLKQ
jgi:peptidyl-prolyl cis-trans isomerase SurA